MSTDTTVRVQREHVEAKPLPTGVEPTRSSEVDIEVPYTDYESAKSHPYTVDYFKLGDTWSMSEGGFPEEISLIESFIEEKINNGDLANSVSAINDYLKTMEKINNLTKEERSVVKIEVMAAYCKFLMAKENIKKNIRRYGKPN